MQVVDLTVPTKPMGPRVRAALLLTLWRGYVDRFPIETSPAAFWQRVDHSSSPDTATSVLHAAANYYQRGHKRGTVFARRHGDSVRLRPLDDRRRRLTVAGQGRVEEGDLGRVFLLRVALTTFDRVFVLACLGTAAVLLALVVANLLDGGLAGLVPATVAGVLAVAAIAAPLAAVDGAIRPLRVLVEWSERVCGIEEEPEVVGWT